MFNRTPGRIRKLLRNVIGMVDALLGWDPMPYWFPVRPAPCALGPVGCPARKSRWWGGDWPA
ncbi:hypothetical protein GCM10010353_27140 [Streptomyces chryseus]|nr:hypothetical protein GCM10010353_27140 [Streptomyces chryseus]